MILRWKLAIRGKLTGTTLDTCFVEGLEFTPSDKMRFTIPDWIAAGDITIRVRLCDCTDCDVLPGIDRCPFAGQGTAPDHGTCVESDIPCVLVDR